MPVADPREEPLPPAASPAATTRRALAWTALGVLLAGAAATRLTGTMPEPGIRGAPPRGAVELVSLSAEDAAAALRASPFDPPARAAMIAAIRDRRLHLVRAPFFGVGGAVGSAVTVTCGAIVRPIVLAASPTIVLLPIERLGQIVVTSTVTTPTDARIGLVTASAPVALPPPAPGRPLILDVIVQ